MAGLGQGAPSTSSGQLSNTIFMGHAPDGAVQALFVRHVLAKLRVTTAAHAGTVNCEKNHTSPVCGDIDDIDSPDQQRGAARAFYPDLAWDNARSARIAATRTRVASGIDFEGACQNAVTTSGRLAARIRQCLWITKKAADSPVRRSIGTESRPRPQTRAGTTLKYGGRTVADVASLRMQMQKVKNENSRLLAGHGKSTATVHPQRSRSRFDS